MNAIPCNKFINSLGGLCRATFDGWKYLCISEIFRVVSIGSSLMCIGHWVFIWLAKWPLTVILTDRRRPKRIHWRTAHTHFGIWSAERPCQPHNGLAQYQRQCQVTRTNAAMCGTIPNGHLYPIRFWCEYCCCYPYAMYWMSANAVAVGTTLLRMITCGENYSSAILKWIDRSQSNQVNRWLSFGALDRPVLIGTIGGRTVNLWCIWHFE